MEPRAEKFLLALDASNAQIGVPPIGAIGINNPLKLDFPTALHAVHGPAFGCSRAGRDRASAEVKWSSPIQLTRATRRDPARARRRVDTRALCGLRWSRCCSLLGAQ